MGSLKGDSPKKLSVKKEIEVKGKGRLKNTDFRANLIRANLIRANDIRANDIQFYPFISFIFC